MSHFHQGHTCALNLKSPADSLYPPARIGPPRGTPGKGFPVVSANTLERRWFSQAEAAEYLGVTTRTIRNYIARGELRGHRVRGSHLVRIDRSDLDALLRPIPTAGGAA